MRRRYGIEFDDFRRAIERFEGQPEAAIEAMAA